MKLAEVSIKRPLLVAVLVTAVLILGGISFSRLSIDLLPEMKVPVGAVFTSYPGISPQEVENQVTRPLESVLSTVNDLDSITSTSSVGQSVIIVMFNWGTDMDFAALQMREKVDLVKRFLPQDAEAPMVLKMDPNMMPVMQIALSSADLVHLQKLVDDVISPRLERVSGVASVWGAAEVEREIHAWVDPVRLEGYGLTLNGLVAVLKGENLNVSSGEIRQGKKDLLVRVTGEFQSIDEIKQVVVSNQEGVPIHLGEIAQIEDGHKKTTQLSRVNGQRSIALMINKQSGTNTVAVANNIRKTIAQLEKELPGVKFNIMMDQSIFVRNSINHIFREIILGVVLAVFIIWLFLRNLRSTLIIATSLPVSLIATFILLYFSDMTLNLISMGGLAIGVGLIVDDSIVVLENIFRHRSIGLGLIEAANVATDEVAGAVTSSTLTTIAVFLPIVFIQGLAAEVFKPMAYTVSFSVLASLIVAFTIVPLLASRLLIFKKEPFTEKPMENPKRLRDNWFERLKNAYRRLLTWALGHRRQVIILVVVLFALSLGGAALVGAEFFPNTDQGYVNVNIEMPKGTSLTETNRVVSFVEKSVKEFSKQIKAIYTGVGYTGNVAMGGTSASDLAQVNIELVKKNERTLSADEMADKIRQKIGTIPGGKIKVTAQDPTMQSMPGMTAVEVKIKGDDLAVLSRLEKELVTLVEKTPGTQDVSGTLKEGRPEVQVLVDRNRAAMYGLAPMEITSTVRTAIDGVVATKYRTVGEEVDLRVQLAAGSTPTLNELANLMISSPTGTKVPLAQVADLRLAVGPNEIEREDQTRMVTVGANLEPGKNLSSVIKDIKDRLPSLALPPGYTVEFGGEQEMMSEVFQNLILALVLAIVLIYLIMVAQFESTLYPFIIMFSVPVTLIGVVASLLITGRAFSVPAFIGVILLMGVVVKNAIILIDYVNKLRQRGLSRNEALLTAGPIRLRPILMTALTVILAMSPLALGIGEGAEIQAPMATVVIGGLLFSTLITLVLVPVIYTIFDDWKEKWSARRQSRLNVSGLDVTDDFSKES